MNWLLILITFLGVNLDFFFILLFLLKKYDLKSVTVGYLIGVWVLLLLSFNVGQILAHIQFIQVILMLTVLSILIIFIIKSIGQVKVVNSLMEKYGEILTKLVYIGVGIYVLFDSGLVAHIISWF